MENPNLTVLTEGRVVKLAFTGGRCTGVDFLVQGRLCSVQRDGGDPRTGAVHTPRLLLLSGLGPQDDLARLGIDIVLGLPGVGGTSRTTSC